MNKFKTLAHIVFCAPCVTVVNKLHVFSSCCRRRGEGPMC